MAAMTIAPCVRVIGDPNGRRAQAGQPARQPRCSVANLLNNPSALAQLLHQILGILQGSNTHHGRGRIDLV
jgi:hypothetical protein